DAGSARDERVGWFREEDRWLDRIGTHLTRVIGVVASNAVNSVHRKALLRAGDLDARRRRRLKYELCRGHWHALLRTGADSRVGVASPPWASGASRPADGSGRASESRGIVPPWRIT